jgi:putative transposase
MAILPGVCNVGKINNPYLRHRFPSEIISYCVWRYYSFPLSYRDIEKMMLYRGIEVTYESICSWCQKFAQQYANQIRRRRPKPADKWHLDEVVIKIKGKQFYLWQALDKAGQVLDILMQRRRNTAAAEKFFRKLLKPVGFPPHVIVTDKLQSYGVAKKKLLKGVEQSGGEFPSTDPSPRTADGTIQISRSCPAVSVCV